MAVRPDMKTPVADLVLALREIAQWYSRHEASLQPVIVQDFGGEQAGRAAAALLDGEEEEFQTERRQDVAWTNDKDALVGAVGPLADVVTAGVEIAYYGDPDLGDVLRDFAVGAPSRIRTLPAARKALQTLRSGLVNHEDKLRQSMGEYDEVLDECQQMHLRAGELSDAYGDEKAETRQAARDRKTARQKALEYIDHVELAARLAQRDNPELIEELQAIYREFVPQPSTPEPVTT